MSIWKNWRQRLTTIWHQTANDCTHYPVRLSERTFWQFYRPLPDVSDGTSDQWRHSGPRHRGRREGGIPLQGVLGREIILAVQDLLPSDPFAGVGRHPAHNAQQGAVAHESAIV